jgi:hypothetical protein
LENLMFKNTPAAESAHVEAVPAELVPLSVLALDLGEPSTGWSSHLADRGIEIVLDDLGRASIARSDARQLFDERRENECRAREVARRQEQQAVEADKAWRSQLPVGLPWYEIPDGVPPVVAMTAAARDESPRKRSMVEDLLDRRDTMVFHPITDEEAS